MGVGQVENLVDLQEKACEKYADNPLFGTKRGGQYQWSSYGEFAELVDQFRGGLASLGTGAGDRVAIIADNREEWAVAAYASYGLGACFVPMYEKQNPEDWQYIINDSGARVLLVANDEIYGKTRGYVDEIESLEHVINLEGAEDDGDSYAHLLKVGEAEPVEAVHPEPGDLAGFIYTSGTTGKPKGVLLTHRNFSSNINDVQTLFDMFENDRSLSFLPWAHSFGQTCELHCMIANGAAIGLAESVATIVQNLPEVRPTLLFSVPRIFNKIYDGLNKRMEKEGTFKRTMFKKAMENADERRRQQEARGKASAWVEAKHKFFDKMVFSKVRERFGGQLRYAFSGGAALNKDVAMFIDNLNIIVYEGYGLSETAPICTANYPGNRKIGSVGKALPSVDVKIDPVEHVQEEGVGEVVIYGPNVMKGYHNLPDKTAQAFTEDGGFRTGDLGQKDDDGYLYIVGRVKEQYKLENGKYVVPAPLEEKLKLAPFINQVMIYGANKPHNVALIIPDEESLLEWAEERGKPKDVEELIEDADVRSLFNEQIGEYSKDFKGFEKPRDFKLIAEEFSTDNDMLTPTLKLKRRNVMKAYGDLIEEMYA